MLSLRREQRREGWAVDESSGGYQHNGTPPRENGWTNVQMYIFDSSGN